MNDDMEIIYKDEYIVIDFIGEITCVNVVKYRLKLNQVIEKTNKDLVFNFSRVSLIDSSGIGLVLGRYNQLKSMHRTLILTGLNDVCYKIFELTGLFSIMPYFSSVEKIKEGVYE